MDYTFEEVLDSIDDVCKIYENMTSIILEYGYEFIRRHGTYGDITGIQEVLNAMNMLDSLMENSNRKSDPQELQSASQVPVKPPPAPRPVSKQKFTTPKMFKTSPRMFFTESLKKPMEAEEVQKETVDMKQKFDALNEMLQNLMETVGSWNASPEELFYDDGSFSPAEEQPTKSEGPRVKPQPKRRSPRTINLGGVEIDPNKRVEVLKLKKALTSAIENRVVDQLKDFKKDNSDGNKFVNVGGLNLQL